MKTSILQPDDFIVGMFITVKDVKKDNMYDFDEDMSNPMQSMMMFGGIQNQQKQNNLEALKGAVIRVDAISLPFIMTTVFENAIRPGQTPRTYSIPLDVRDANFMKINEEYISVYLGNGTFTALLQGEDFNKIQNIEGFKTFSDILDILKIQLIKEEERRKNED